MPIRSLGEKGCVLPLLHVQTNHDGLLSAIAPLGLGAAAGTALVVDTDPDGPAYPGSASLATMLAEGPRRADLTPARAGLAVLRSGGASLAEAGDLLGALASGWPAVVVRVPARQPVDGPVVPVAPALPGALAERPAARHVVQATGLAPAPRDGIVLPRPSGRLVRDLLSGVVRPRDRWIRAWRPVWEVVW